MENETEEQLEFTAKKEAAADDRKTAFLRVTLSSVQIVDLLSEELDREMELSDGALAGPVPCGEYLVCKLLESLGTFGLLDGSHYAVVAEAIRRLEEDYEK